jgi:Bacterial regulatory protein, Fis family
LVEAGLRPTRAARQLGIGRSNLYRAIAERHDTAKRHDAGRFEIGSEDAGERHEAALDEKGKGRLLADQAKAG